MENNNKDNGKKHLQENKAMKLRLRKIGFICLGIGGLFTIIALIDFFSAFNGYGSPSLFFLFFLSFPLIFVGLVCLKFGYMGAVSSYVASQTAPVVKDVTNYMLDGTREEVGKTFKHVVNSIKGTTEEKICPKCNTSQDANAKFCDNCGTALAKVCNKCNEENDSDAMYCKNCGNRLK